MKLINDRGEELLVDLQVDSSNYHILSNATKHVKSVPGMICEIGTRRGGSLLHIVNGLCENGDDKRNMICIDPYGNIDYINADGDIRKADYTNRMKLESQVGINAFLLDKSINVVFLCLEDTEFFNRFSDGVPFYNDVKVIETEYALVFFDGPHGTDALLKEVEFFNSRSATGSVWVFDDTGIYNHGAVEGWMMERGWSKLDQAGGKASYVKQ
jgi:cephalosporin hydroxylase